MPTTKRRTFPCDGWINPKLKPKLPFNGPARSVAHGEDELRDLIAACRAGRLADVATWIEDGRPLQVDPTARNPRNRTTPLEVAIETGQHDLVRLLLAAGYRTGLEPSSPFDRVLRHRRLDLLDLLLEAGADPGTVDPDAVFGTYNREVMERFWSLGVDLAGDGAMAAALAYETRNRPLYGFVKNHTGDPRIQCEADVGLGYAIGRQNDKAVSLCLWSGANPRHSVPLLGDGHEPSDDWTMTAFERAVWEGVPQYLKKLGFNPGSDDIEPLYENARDSSVIEALVKIQPPKDWHPIAERFLDHVLVMVHLFPGEAWGATWDLECVFQLGGRLGSLSGLTIRRLRKHLKGLDRDAAKRFLRLLEKHTEPSAFLDVIAHPMFIEAYKDWGLKRKLIEELADGSRTASAKARRVLKVEKGRPPVVQVPWNTADYVQVTREELYELVWSAPMVQVVKQHGLSDNGLRKICRKLDVPTPPRGYWALGAPKNQRMRLPSPREGWPIQGWLPRPVTR